MRAETLEPGLPASLFEPIAKGFGRMWFSKLRYEINQMASERRVNALAQRRQDRQFVRLDEARTALRLGEHKLLHLHRIAAGRSLDKRALHLRAEPDDI